MIPHVKYDFLLFLKREGVGTAIRSLCARAVGHKMSDRVIPSQSRMGLTLTGLGKACTIVITHYQKVAQAWAWLYHCDNIKRLCGWMCENKYYSLSFSPSCQGESSIRSTFTESNSGLCTMVSPCGNQTLSRASTTRSRSATLVTYMKAHSFECST